MDQERSFTEAFVTEDRVAGDSAVVRYERTFENGDQVQVFLTERYIEVTDKRVITDYLNHAVADIIKRNAN